jgi:heparosan-N-sulfate-glucuronate 5-epimerase
MIGALVAKTERACDAVGARLRYWGRILPAYFGRGSSQVTFWHDQPTLNPRAFGSDLGEYYQDFATKAHYTGPYDGDGVPLLDYRGSLGRQYNPIAIAQYALANYNVHAQTGRTQPRERFLRAANWLATHLERNQHAVWVWQHHFDWEYWQPLRAPWYSALAQGQGISALVRAHSVTNDAAYLRAAVQGFEAFARDLDAGGVRHVDDQGRWWLEEYVVWPPTHILNGFLWSLWGVRDFQLATGDDYAAELFGRCLTTVEACLPRYDLGYWSRYDLSPTAIPMIASPFYHRLHIVQLRITHRLAPRPVLFEYAERWARFERNRWSRGRALAEKAFFKMAYF